MRVQRIKAECFRNWSIVDVELPKEGTLFLTGNNGQGKTNLIEAIYFSLRNRSFRTNAKEHLVQIGEQHSFVSADVCLDSRLMSIETKISTTQKSSYLLNNKPFQKINDLPRLFPVVVFQPEDLYIVKGSPSLRRDLLDDLLVVHSRRFAEVVRSYERTLQQRNSLLKQITGRLSDDLVTTLDVWDNRLSAYGNELVTLREQTLDQLKNLVSESYYGIANDRQKLSVCYSRSWKGDLLSELNKNRSQDILKSFTSVGPHRDDFEIYLNDSPARFAGSQGEQRTIAFGIKLAISNYMSSVLGSFPVVMLDDVVSELDAGRVERLFANLPNCQTLVTGTFVPENVSNLNVFKVEEGRIVS